MPLSLSGRDEMLVLSVLGAVVSWRTQALGLGRPCSLAAPEEPAGVLSASFSGILLNTDVHANTIGILVICRCSGSVRVTCGLKFCVPNKLLGHAAAGSWKGNYWEKQDLRGFLQGSKKGES